MIHLCLRCGNHRDLRMALLMTQNSGVDLASMYSISIITTRIKMHLSLSNAMQKYFLKKMLFFLTTLQSHRLNYSRFPVQEAWNGLSCHSSATVANKGLGLCSCDATSVVMKLQGDYSQDIHGSSDWYRTDQLQRLLPMAATKAPAWASTIDTNGNANLVKGTMWWTRGYVKLHN